MKVLLFATALRKESLNKKLIKEAFRLLPPEMQGEILNMSDYLLPVYDGDIERDDFPENVKMLGNKIAEADALIISSPEYNGSIAAPLKNLIDWVSRLKPMPLKQKHVLLFAASPGAFGGVRGLWHTRVPFEALGSYVFPDMLAVPNAMSIFNQDGQIIEKSFETKVANIVKDFLTHAQKK